MECRNDRPLQLIDEYEKHPMLWDAKHVLHFSRNKKVDAWEIISNYFEVSFFEAKKKLIISKNLSAGKRRIGRKPSESKKVMFT